jgi:predicted PurR-regulated permease PerM
MAGPTERPEPPARGDWRTVHLWHIQGVRDVLVVLGVLALLWLGQRISIVTVPLLLALLLAYLLEPVIVLAMSRLRLGRPAAVAAVIALFIFLVVVPVAAGLAVGSVQVAGLVVEIAEKARVVDENAAPGLEGGELVAARRAVLNQAGKPWLWIRDQLAEARAGEGAFATAFTFFRGWVGANAEELASRAAGAGVRAASSVLRVLVASAAVVFAAFLTVFFFYFISSTWGSVGDFIRGLLPATHRDRALHLARRFNAVISAFIRGRLTIAFIQSFVFTIGYWLIGVPAAFILGPIVAALSIVPYLALVGVPISITLLWIEAHAGFRGSAWWIVGAPLAFYFAAQFLDDYILTPRIQGRGTGMSTPAILAASLAGGALFGAFGLLIAIPLVACIRILLEEEFWPKFRAWADGRARDALPINPG